MRDDHNIMERNQACGLFLYVLNKDIICIVRSYTKRPFKYLRPITVVKGCVDQMQAMKENAYEDLDEGCIVLFVSNIRIRMHGHSAEQFLKDLQYGCGVCEACLAPREDPDRDANRHEGDV